MQNNYHFLKQLVPILREKMVGLELVECFSQSKDELVLGFAGERYEFWMRANFLQEFSSLGFPDHFARAKRNTVNLFGELKGKVVEGITLHENERSFVLHFSGGFDFLFKLYGNRSNAVLYKDGQYQEMFMNKFHRDAELVPEEQNRPIEQTFEAFAEAEGEVKAVYPTLGKLALKELEKRWEGEANLEERWAILQDLIKEMETPPFYLCLVDEKPVFSMLSLDEVEATHQDPLEALNAFFSFFGHTFYINRDRGLIRRDLQKRLEQSKKYISNTEHQLQKLSEGISKEEIGHILMANLHAIEKGVSEVELHDFYRDCPIKIKLKKNLSPQKNAEGYYRKAKNQKKELQSLEDNLMARLEQVERIERQLQDIEDFDNHRDLRKYLKAEGLDQKTLDKAEEASRFKTVEFQGWRIQIGRNAKNNDELTGSANKEDLWLHAKDVFGSHVLIKFQSGKEFPQSVKERAAELAGYFSKRRNDTVCPVICTKRKYVRKVRGVVGKVIYEREEVLLVEPRNS